MTPMSNEVHDVLVKARAKVAQGWTQGAWARSASGRSVGEHSRAATFWCVRGAVSVAGRRTRRVLDDVEATFRSANGIAYGDLANWNDEPRRTQAEVLAAFDKAIASTHKDV